MSPQLRGNSSVVEHNLAKVGVASSNLVSRSTYEAGWQSGYAADCKSVDAGSIPTPASIFLSLPCPGGGIGRHKGFKIPRSFERAGSIPASGTTSQSIIPNSKKIFC